MTNVLWALETEFFLIGVVCLVPAHLIVLVIHVSGNVHQHFSGFVNGVMRFYSGALGCTDRCR
jgi:hypothetical protein